MSNRLKSLLLLCVALWLPLQAASALAMPFCRHAVERAAQAEAMAGEGHCHEHAPASAGHVGALDCDQCGMCHLATAGYLPVEVTLVLPDAVSVLVELPQAALPSHIGDPPQQPPRRLS